MRSCFLLQLPWAVTALVCSGDKTYSQAVSAGCTSIDGDLLVTATQKSSLDSVSGLNQIGGDLIVVGNPALTTLGTALDTLLTVGGQIYIVDNAELTTLAALGAVSNVSGRVRIMANPSLSSLEGLSRMAIGGSLYVSDNNLLAVSAGSALCNTSVAGNFTLRASTPLSDQTSV